MTKYALLCIAYAIAVVALAGCSGTFAFPTCDRPLTLEETTHVLALADLIEVARERWQGNAQTLRALVKAGRVCVGTVGGKGKSSPLLVPRARAFLDSQRPGK